MDDKKRQLYVALRATIRERGTVRLITFLVTLVAWGALVLVWNASGPRDIVGTLVSLLILAAGFEVVFQIHIGVERVGRYLQVDYEDEWERAAMAYGQTYRGASSDPLFASIFVLATVVNLLPVLRALQMPFASGVLVAAHLLFLLRIRLAGALAHAQREQDLKRFEELRSKWQAADNQPLDQQLTNDHLTNDQRLTTND